MSGLVLKPRRGTLSARRFENELVGIPATLFFDIAIPMEPFEYEGEIQETSVRLDFIDFDLCDWRELVGRTFIFPKNPDDGYIDGSMYLGGAHNPAYCTRIAFSRHQRSTLTAELDIEFDFEYEGPEELGKFCATWQMELEINPAELDKVVALAQQIDRYRRLS